MPRKKITKSLKGPIKPKKKVSKSRKSRLIGTKTSGHETLNEGECPLCAHPHRAILEELYAEWTSSAIVAARANILTSEGTPDRKVVEKHMRAVGADKRRDGNYQGFYRKIKDLAAERLDLDLIPAEALLRAAMKAAEQEDKIEKRVQTGVQVDNRRQIALFAPPPPGGITSNPNPQLTKGSSPATIEAEFTLAVPGRIEQEAVDGT